MDLDQTQAIDHSEEEIEQSEEDKSNTKKKEVAHLKVFSQQGFKETIFPIHQGDNFIGRSAKCDVTIPIKALSKKHACVEVQKDLHLIYDCDSKNRTKKGKSFLKPSVRYEVKHGDMITLGDVKCQYLVGVEMDNEEEDDDTCSETESESMLPVAGSEDDVGMDKPFDMCQDDPKKSNGKAEIQVNDLLHSTQNYPASKPDKDIEKAYAADTDSGTDDDMPHSVAAAGTVFYSSEDEEEVPRLKAPRFKSKKDGSMDGQTLAFGLASPDNIFQNRDSAGCIQSSSVAPTLMLSPEADDHLSERSDDAARHGSSNHAATGESDSLQTCQPTLPCGSESDDESAIKRPQHPEAVDSECNQPTFEPTLVYGSESEEESPKEKPRVSEAFNEPTILYESDSEEGINRESKGQEKPILSVPTSSCTFESKEERIGLQSKSKSIADHSSGARESSNIIDISKLGADSFAVEKRERELENEVCKGTGRTLNTDATLLYHVDEISSANDESEPDSAVNKGQTDLEKTLSYAEPTWAYDTDEFEARETDNEPNVDLAETFVEDSATQQYTADSEDEPLSIRQRETKDKKEALQQTVAYDLEATQAYLVEEGEGEGSDTSDSQPLPLGIEAEATQDANVATLAYGLEDDAHNSALEASDRDDSNDNEEHVPMENKPTLACDLQATQAYGTTAFDDDDDDNEDDPSDCDVVGFKLPLSKGEAKADENEASQKALAFELEATQAYGASNNGEDSDSDSLKAVWDSANEATKPTLPCGLSLTLPYSGNDANNSNVEGDGDNGMKKDLRTDGATYCLQQENQATLAYGVEEAPADDNEAAVQEAKAEDTMPKRRSKRGRKQAVVIEESREADDQQIPEDAGGNVTVTENEVDDQTESELTVTSTGAGSRKGRRGALKVTLENEDHDKGEVTPSSTSQRRKKRVSAVKGKVEVAEDNEEELIEISTRKGKRVAMRITFEPEKQEEEMVVKQASTRTRGRKGTTGKTPTRLEQEEGGTKQTLTTGRKSKQLRGKLLEEFEDESGTPKAEEDVIHAGSSRGRRGQISKTVISETPMKTDKPTETDVCADPQTSGSEAGAITEKVNVRRGARGRGKTATKKETAQTTGSQGAGDSPMSKEATGSVVRATPSRGRSRGRGTKIKESQGSEDAWEDSSLSKDVARSEVRPTPSRQRSRGRGAKWTEPHSLEASINFDETLTESPSVNMTSAGRSEGRGRGKRAQKSSTETETSESQTSAVSDVQMAPSPILLTASGKRGQGKGRGKRPCPSSQQLEVTDESSQEASTGGPSENSLAVKGRGKGKRAKQIFEQEETSDSTVTLSETPDLSESIQDSQESIVDSDKGQQNSRLTKNTANTSESQKVEETPLKKGRRGKQPSIGQSPTPQHRGLLGAARPKIMFTGLVDKQGEKVVTSLGGELVDNIHNCTHLVTDKVRRTVKFLCGLAGGQIIVLPSWLEACKKAKSFVDTTPFLVKDKEAEKQYNFDLQRSHELALQRGLLEGYKVHVTKKVKPEPAQMKDIIQSAKGEFLPSVPKNRDCVFIISCEEDKAVCKKPLEACIPVVSAEVLLTGVLQQNLNLEEYRLFGEEGRSQDSTSSVQSKRKRGTAHGNESSSTPETKGSKRKRR